MLDKPWYIAPASVGDDPNLCQTCAQINFPWLLENDFSSARYARWQSNAATDDEACPIKIPWVNEHASYLFPDLSLGFLFEILEKRERCSFCRLLSFTVAMVYGTEPELLLAQNFVYAPPQFVFCTLLNTRKEWVQGESYDLVIQLSNIQQDFRPFEQALLHRIRDDRPVPFEGRSVAPRVDFRVIGDWLAHFDSSHASSTTTHETIPGFRLIDVVNMNVVPVDGPDGCRYLCLSYVWGGPQRFQNIKANEGKLRKPGSLSEHRLPETIEDAIEVTAKVGERYLWVDSLCIIQDDGDAKMAQINAMDQIYSCALATIVAIDATSCHDSLSGVRDTVERRMQYTADLRGIKLANKYPKTNASKQHFWKSRGWTFQEHALSRRCIHFNHDMLEFESEDGVWREDVHPPPHEPKLLRASVGFPVGDSLSEIALLSNIQLFAFSVSFYSFRSLTYDTDALHAFQGVLNVHRPRFRRDFLYGMPSSELESALIWQPSSLLQRRVNGDKEDSFPSWSWVAWKGNLILPVLEATHFSRLTWVDAIDKTTEFTSDQWRGAETAQLGTWKTVADRRGLHVAPWYFEMDNPTARFAHPVSRSVLPAMQERRFLQPDHHVLTFYALSAQMTSIPGSRSLEEPELTFATAPDGVRSHSLQDRFNRFCGIVYLHSQNPTFDTVILDCIAISRTAFGSRNTSDEEPPSDDSDVTSIRDGYGERQELRKKSSEERSASSYFDYYDFEPKWQAYDILVIARGCDGVTERVGVGLCLCEAFWDAGPRRERILLK